MRTNIEHLQDKHEEPPREVCIPPCRSIAARAPAQAGAARSRRPRPAARRDPPDRGGRAGLARRRGGRAEARPGRDRPASSLGRAAGRRAARDRRRGQRHGRDGERVFRPSRRALGGRPGALVRRRAHSRFRRAASAGVAALRARPRTAGPRPHRQRRRNPVGDGGRASLRRAGRGRRRAGRGLADREPAAAARRRLQRGDRADAAPGRRRRRPERRGHPLARRRSAPGGGARLAARDVSLPRRTARRLASGVAR